MPSCVWCKGAHRKSANLSRCRYANAVGSLTTIQFGSGDRSCSHKYRGTLREENSIDIRPAPSKDNRRLEGTGTELLCFKKQICVLRLSRCRVRTLRSTETKESSKSIGSA